MASKSVHAAAAAVVATWADRWFVSGGLALLRIEPAHHRLQRLKTTPPTVASHSDLTVDLGSNGGDLIILHALRRTADDLIAEADKQPLERLVGRVVDDLVAELSQYLGMTNGLAERNHADDAATTMIISDGQGRTILSLGLTSKAAKALIDKSIASPLGLRPPLVPLSTALDAVSVGIEMRLSDMVLDARAIRGLAVGDVVVLDRLIGDGFDLALIGAQQSFAQADLIDCDGAQQLKFRRRLQATHQQG
jgi:hypothetical protein